MPRIRMSELPDGIRNAVSGLYLNVENVSVRTREIDGETVYNVRIREQFDIEAKELLILIANGLESIEPFVFHDVLENGTRYDVASTRMRFTVK